MSGVLDTYLEHLGEALRREGLRDPRLIEEVRQHLLDGIDAGVGRGLTLRAAEEEAVAKCGAPETIAAHAAAERRDMRTWRSALEGIWSRRRVILAAAIAAAIVAAVSSPFVKTARYQSESTLQLSSPSALAFSEQLRTMTQRAVSGALLNDPANIRLNIMSETPSTGVSEFKVTYVSSNPKSAQDGASRLARAYVDDALTEALAGRFKGQVRIIEEALPGAPMRRF